MTCCEVCISFVYSELKLTSSGNGIHSSKYHLKPPAETVSPFTDYEW